MSEKEEVPKFTDEFRSSVVDFSKDLNGKVKSYKYLPSEYWLKINNKKLNFIHFQNLLVKDNYFNNSRLLSYAIMLKNSFK